MKHLTTEDIGECDEITTQISAGSVSLLLVDDDISFCQILSHALKKIGFDVIVEHGIERALPAIHDLAPEYAIVDLKLNGASGLVLVEALHKLDPETRIIILTGYASVATAVEAVKLGATHYLPKPANADEIVAAFNHEARSDAPIESLAIPLDIMEWEYIQNVLREQGNNISSAARALKMHRRTLQRKLSRLPPEYISK